MSKKTSKVEEDKNEIVATNNNSVALLNEIESYLAENNVRDIESDEVIIPRINLLQSMSKQVKKTEAEYIKGAEEGFLFNTLTKDLIDGATGLTFVPCYNERVYNEWVPLDLGGGLAKRWGSDTSFKNSYTEEKGKWQDIEKDAKTGKDIVKSEVVKTAEYYVLIVDRATGVFSPAVIGFSGTKYKVHRKLINDISLKDYITSTNDAVTPPPFYRVYDLFTVPESDGTNSWFNYKPVRNGIITDLPNAKAILEAAKELRKLVIEGKVIAEAEQQDVKLDDDNTAI